MLCKFFAKGICRNGRHCRFSHEATNPKPDVNTIQIEIDDSSPSSLNSKVCGGPSGQRVPFKHSAKRLGSRGGMYMEIFPQLIGESQTWTLRLVIPVSTKISNEDRELWSQFPVTLSGKYFNSAGEVHDWIRGLLRYSREGEALTGQTRAMLEELFAYHPSGPSKMEGVLHIEVGPAETHSGLRCLRLVKSDNSWEPISYVKCLRSLASKHRGNQQITQDVVIMAELNCSRNCLSVKVSKTSDSITTEQPITGVGLALSLENQDVSIKVQEEGRKVHTLKSLSLAMKDDPRHGYGEIFPVIDVPRGSEVQVQTTETIGVAAVVEAEMPVQDLRSGLEVHLHLTRGSLQALPLDDLKSVCSAAIVHTVEVRASSLATSAETSDKSRRARANASQQICADMVQSMTTYELQDLRARLKSEERRREQLERTVEQLQQEASQQLSIAGAPVSANLASSSSTSLASQAPSVRQDAMSGQAPECLAGSSETDSILDDIRKTLMADLHPQVTHMLQASLELLSRGMYTSPSRAFWELIQNADDCDYSNRVPALAAHVTKKYLWIEYNERGFAEQDVRAVCSIGASTKKSGQTGQKGIGFKACFGLSQTPHVLSGAWKFFFDDQASCPFPQITPYPIAADHELPRPPPKEVGTAIYLPLRAEAPAVELTPSSLLFLRRLRHISMLRNGTIEIQRKDDRIDDTCRKTTLSFTSAVTSQPVLYEFLVASRVMPQGLGEGHISVAFPLREPHPETDDTESPEQTIFCTLPVCPVSGIKTPLDAPFELTASREELLKASAKNIAIRSALVELWLDMARKYTQHLNGMEWKLRPCHVSGFWSSFATSVCRGLRQLPLVPIKGSTNLLSLECCRMERGLVQTLSLGPEDLKELGLGVPTDEWCQAYPEVAHEMAELSMNEVLDLLARSKSLSTQPATWFDTLAKTIASTKKLDGHKLSAARIFAVVGKSERHARGVEGIFESAPELAECFLKVLDKQVCRKEVYVTLLRRMGSGGSASLRTATKVALKVLLGMRSDETAGEQLGIPLFSWKILEFFCKHFEQIVAEETQSSESPLSLQALIRDGVSLPSAIGNTLCKADELKSPYCLGSRVEGHITDDMVREPASGLGCSWRLSWELLFLRLGVKSNLSPTKSAIDDLLRAFKQDADRAVLSHDLKALLELYESRGELDELRQRCVVQDHGGLERNLTDDLLSTAWRRVVGNDFVLYMHRDSRQAFSKLLRTEVQPTIQHLLKFHLKRLAAAVSADDPSSNIMGVEAHLKKAYSWIHEQWNEAREAKKRQQARVEGIALPEPETEPRKEEEDLQLLEDVQKGIEELKQSLPLPHGCLPAWQSVWEGPLENLFGSKMREFFVDVLGVVSRGPPVSMVYLPTPRSHCSLQAGPAVPPSSPATSSARTTNAAGASCDNGYRASEVAQTPRREQGAKRGLDFLTGQEVDESKLKRPRQGTTLASSVLLKSKAGPPQPPFSYPRDPCSVDPASQDVVPPMPRERESPHEDPGDIPGNLRLFDEVPGEAARFKKLLDAIFKEGGHEKLQGQEGSVKRRRVPLLSVWFTQTNTGKYFVHGHLGGKQVEAVARGIADGHINAANVPINVVEFKNRLWTLNNRSLRALRRAHELSGSPQDITVSVWPVCPVTAKFVSLHGPEFGAF